VLYRAMPYQAVPSTGRAARIIIYIYIYICHL
jgi:hypothetical protein